MPTSVMIAVIAVTALLFVLSTTWILYSRFPFHKIYRSKVHLQDSFDSIDDPIAIVRSDYTIMRANTAYASMVSRPFASILGKKCFTVLRSRTRACEDCRLAETLKNRERAIVERSPHPSAEGPNAAISLTFFPFFQRNQAEVKCAIEHIRDITRLEQLKNSLETRNHQLEKTTTELQKAESSLRSEIDMARVVQQGIFPQNIPTFDGLKIAVNYHPIEAIGGDIYDFIQFSPTRLGVFIGDASGHGLHAAFVSTISKMSLYSHTKTELPPGELLKRINQDLIQNIHTSHYLTCFWAIFDLADNTVTFARAGHPKPIVVRNKDEIHFLSATGTFLGILENTQFTESSFQCRKGDRIYLFTDGVYVVTLRNIGGKPVLDQERFHTVIRSCNHLPFEELVPAMNRELENFAYEDDYTVVILEVTGEGRG